MSISIDLHVKCPFYKLKLLSLSHGIWGRKGYIIVNILSQGAVIFSNVLNLQE